MNDENKQQLDLDQSAKEVLTEGTQDKVSIKDEVTLEKNPPQEEAKPEQPKTIAKKAYDVDVREMKTPYYDPVIFQQLKGMAENFKASGALAPSENAATLLVKMQAGLEMGMKPIEAIKSFYFVNGTINIFGAAIVKRLREHGWKIKYTDEPNKCTATVSKDDEEYVDTLTFLEAEQSRWTKTSSGQLKPGWLEGVNRKLKLRYGVTSMIIKTYLPEVLGSAVDIAEVAMDSAPVYQEYAEAAPVIEGGEDPATPSQVKTILSLDPEASQEEVIKLTKQEAAKRIKELGAKKK